ncbi:MAG TPA: flagellar type III secretion system pore protein FliP, partial [Clostridia bacterium]|nr:flagellar type III secretion system pore protein FliP [Clostridia bacterium]
MNKSGKTGFLIKNRHKIMLIILLAVLVLLPGQTLAAGESIIPDIGITIGGEGDTAGSLRILLTLTVLALAPSIIIMMTSFTRIIIVMSFTRSAIGMQQTPPNQVLIGLALFLTFFIMAPVISEVNEVAYRPLVKGEITEDEAFEKGMKPIREFMLKQTYAKDMNLFLNITGSDAPEKPEDISNAALISAFITSELKRGFQMGFFIYIPFIMIDM